MSMFISPQPKTKKAALTYENMNQFPLVSNQFDCFIMSVFDEAHEQCCLHTMLCGNAIKERFGTEQRRPVTYVAQQARHNGTRD